eukprot:GHVQ01020042.1.p1 GENE.GHVQ01020042.1~~GHVQ01020042.1.p1  ORF type:complete len:100 (+),score=4.37 GHVQ01020042.1:3-302(+)
MCVCVFVSLCVCMSVLFSWVFVSLFVGGCGCVDVCKYVCRYMCVYLHVHAVFLHRYYIGLTPHRRPRGSHMTFTLSLSLNNLSMYVCASCIYVYMHVQV